VNYQKKGETLIDLCEAGFGVNEIQYHKM